MAPAEHPLHSTDMGPSTPEADAAALADWIEAEPLPALHEYRQELAGLAARGQPDTGPVVERLVDVIAALQATGRALREDDVATFPSALSAVLARCTADIEEAQAAVAESHRLVEDAMRHMAGLPEDPRDA